MAWARTTTWLTGYVPSASKTNLASTWVPRDSRHPWRCLPPMATLRTHFLHDSRVGSNAIVVFLSFLLISYLTCFSFFPSLSFRGYVAYVLFCFPTMYQYCIYICIITYMFRCKMSTIKCSNIFSYLCSIIF